ncbi:ankyrin repeat-containing domain protein [Aspergillus karnatakaensis]|uniref:ankyrin repeat domain-containing protein n=1 Tax=Aspergillus karnatakaensis TaxID=1810916 RepID=UPI003CCDCB97
MAARNRHLSDRAIGDRAEVITTHVDVESGSASIVEVDTNLNTTNGDSHGESGKQPITQLNIQLHQAVSQGNLEELTRLLSLGAEVNSADEKNGETALHKACSSNLGPTSEIIADALLQHGAEPNLRTFLGDTPLLLACLAGEESPIQRLMRAGADVRAAHNNGDTPLHIVSRQGKISMMGVLFGGGARVDEKNNAGRTALHEVAIAGGEGAGDAAKLLLQSLAFVDETDHWGNTPMHLSGFGKSVAVMQALLEYDADVNSRNSYGETPLHEACRLDFREGVEFLLKNGADVNLADVNGVTPEKVAMGRRLGGIVRLINQCAASSDSVSDEKGPDEDGDEPESPKRYEIERPTQQEPESPATEKRSIEPHTDGQLSNTADFPQISDLVWAGIRRDNGDGFTLATYNKHDISFDAKLESIRPCVHEGTDMHEIQLLVNFMRPYSMDYRIRYAEVNVLLHPKDETNAPHLRGIMPQADRVEVSDQEITSGKTLKVGAAGNGGPSSVNISMEGSKSRTSTFKGVRIIHGAIKDRMHACWRMYEEPGSKSGLPEIVRLLMLVRCDGEFQLRLNLSVKACHSFTFGIPRTLTAPAGPTYSIPDLPTIANMEQASRLKQMLDVADRAATVVEEASTFETRFAHAIRNHAKKDLIMQAGMKESYLQEWTDILDASKLSDFTVLRDKLVEMAEKEAPRRVREHIVYDRTERRWSPLDEDIPYRDLPYRRERERSRGKRRGYSYVPDRIEIRGPSPDRLARVEGYEYRRSRNALHGFSAVGPGYHVSRLA